MSHSIEHSFRFSRGEQSKLNEMLVGQAALALEGGLSPVPPSRLCQACLSVLTRDDLEIAKLYAHHIDLKGFVEASRMKCYICSWVFAGLSQDVQEALRLLAEGKIPANVITHKVEPGIGRKSDHRTRLRNYLEDYWVEGGGVGPGNDLSWLSLIGMKIQPSSAGQPHMEILVLLNPFYEVYFPLTTTVDDEWICNLWKTVREEISSPIRKPMIITDEGGFMSTLAQ